MAKYDDYQLEEMENSAVEKSVIAKRVAAGAGLLGVGAVSAYGAEHVVNGDTEQSEVSELTEDDMQAGAEAGATDGSTETSDQSHVETHNVEEVHVYHHDVPEPTDEPEIEIDTTTHLYDNEGNLVGSIDSGTFDGKDFAILDTDADGDGDILMYDANENGKIDDNEMADISDSNYIMGQGEDHHDINIVTGEEIADAHDDPGFLSNDIYINEKDELADITNDFSDEKSGEEYGNDLAENNSDYQNDSDIDHYSAGVDHHDELAYNDEEGHAQDYEFNSEAVSDNDSDYFENHDDSAEEDLAYDSDDSYDADSEGEGYDDDSFDDPDTTNDYAYNDDMDNGDDSGSFHDDTADYDIV